MARNRTKIKGRLEKGTFFLTPHEYMKCESYRNLSAKAVKMLFETFARFNGRNNGDFDFSLKTMKIWGWSSNDTISKAKKELINMGWLVLTRQGGLGIGPNLYALTTHKIDDCEGKHDRKPTLTPLGYWKLGFNPEDKKK